MNTWSKSVLFPIHPGTIIKGKWNRKEYVVKRIIGSGENGTVYLVALFERLYALKVSLVTFDLSYEINSINRLNKALGSILGFSVLDVDDVVIQGEVYTFYVMPYQVGITIEQHLYGKGQKDYTELFKQVIKLIDFIHNEAYVYGDLKPEHILIDTSTNQLSLIDFGGVTIKGEGIRQFTELFDRGSWKAGNRKANPHYDLFSIAMIFVQIGIGRNKLLKIFNQTRSLNEVYDIIPKIPSLQLLTPIFKKILQGKLLDSKEVINEIDNQIASNNKSKETTSYHWIDWLFNSSILLFLSLFIYFIYH